MFLNLTRDAWLGHSAMLAFSIAVAGAFSLGSMTANLIEPIAITTARFALAACIIGAIAVAGKRVKTGDFKAPWRYLLMGSAMAVYFVLMFEGLKTATPVSTAVVFTLTPILSGIFGWFLLGQVTTPKTAFWLVIGAIGALWIIFRADVAAFLRFDIGRGEMVFFFGCVSHAFYTPLIRRLNRGEHPLVFTMGMLIAGTIALIIWDAPTLINTQWNALPTITWIALAYLTIFATAFSFFMVQFASLRLPASKVMSYTYMTPAIVILWEGALNHGWPSAYTLIGVGLIIAALLGLLRS